MNLELFNAGTPHSAIIRLILQAKNLPFSEHPHQSPLIVNFVSEPTLKDKITIHGTEIIIYYLCEKYPHPSLLPIEPRHKAVTNMLVRNVLHDLATFDFDAFKSINGVTPFMLGTKPGILDICLAVLSPANDPFWRSFRNQLRVALELPEEAAA